MRLTLRTLLAYRDGALKPEDNEDLHGRIQKSEYSGNILRRISAVTNRSFATSTIVGKGPGGDPNAYAEYLDDVMQSEKVPEFERVCLESDAHLAELAACHSLLCSAMQKAVRVPESVRQTAILAGDPDQREAISRGLSFRRQRGNDKPALIRADVAHESTPRPQPVITEARIAADHAPQEQPVGVQAPMVASGGGSIKPQGLDLEDSALAAGVPEYLVGTTPRNWRIPLAIGALLALLAVLLWQALGPWDQVQQLFLTDVSNGKPEDPVQAQRAEVEFSADAPNDDEGSAESSPDDEEGLDAEPSNSNEVRPGAPAADTTTESSEAQPDPIVTEENALNPGGETDSAQGLAETPTETAGSLGAWLPKDDAERAAVLFSRSTDMPLKRLQPGDTLDSGSQLIVPPYYRTTIDLPGGVLWTACGPSLLTAGDTSGNHLTTSLCKSIVRGGPLGKRLKLATPAGDCVIELEGVASSAAIEVGHRQEKNGSILDEQATKAVLIIVSLEGNISVSFADENFTFGLGEGLAIVVGTKPKQFTLRNIPTWYKSSFQRPIDGIAANDFVGLLLPGSDDSLTVEDQLASLVRYPKPYVAAMAIECCMMTGNWRPFAEAALVSPRLSSYWEPVLDLAGQMLAADPASAAKVRSLFSAQGSSSDRLFQMLIGFSVSELENGALSMLVSQLAVDDLASRVLAFYQLKKVTGKVSAYLPHDPNRTSISIWRRELATMRLQVLPVGDIISERIAP